jgi:hypothetical protein
MTKRVLVLCALAVALVLPAAALADGGDGGTGTQPARLAAARIHRAAVAVRVARRLDRRYQAFAKRCLVDNAPDRCEKAAEHVVARIGKLRERLQKVDAAIASRCAAASAPARCANVAQAHQRITDALAKLASAESAVTARYPSAGS